MTPPTPKDLSAAQWAGIRDYVARNSGADWDATSIIHEDSMSGENRVRVSHLLAAYDALAAERDAAVRERQHWADATLAAHDENEVLRAKLDAAEQDAARYQWLRDTLHGAKAGGGVEVNDALQVYEKPVAGEEVRLYWYQDTPVGFYEVHGATLDAAIDTARTAATAQGE